MSTKLTKPVEREVTIAGIDKPVLVSFAPRGVSARVKGSKTTLVMGWTRLLENMATPQDVPSHLYGRPLELLKVKGRK